MGTSQKRAIQNYRTRLRERGLSRFEVLGRDADRELIRSLARRLAEDSSDASRLRATVSQTIADEPAKKSGVLAALRRSPLVGADLDLSRADGKAARSTFDALSARHQHPQQCHQARAFGITVGVDVRKGRYGAVHRVPDPRRDPARHPRKVCWQETP